MTEAAPEHESVEPRIAMAIVGAVVVVVALYLVIGSVIGLDPLFAGFFFIFYMTAVMKADLSAFLPALVGALAGIGVSWLLHGLPDAIGPVGYVVPLAAILALLYLAVQQQLPILVNNALWLFLSVGTIPAVQDHVNLGAAVLAVLYGAAFIGALLGSAHLLQRLQARRKPAVAVAPLVEEPVATV